MASRREKGRRKRSAQLLGLLIVVLSLVAVVLVVYLAIVLVRSFSSGASPEVAVPNIVGMTQEEAERTLNEVNLGLQVVESAFSENAPAGTVISQLTPPGSRVRENRRIRVIRSLGKPNLKVPNLIGTSFESAQKNIAEAGLSLGKVKKLYLKKFKLGEVTTQDPEPNRVFTSPVKIDLTIACADTEYTVTVPSTVGKPLYVAEKLFHNANLSIRSVSYQTSPLGSPGEVLSQMPEPGTSAEPGSGVTLTVKIPEDFAQATACNFRFRFRLPSSLPGGTLKLEIEDKLGKADIHPDEVAPGEIIEQLLTVQGNAIIRVYLDGHLIREDRF
ncbi:MAG: hypothetical protein A2Y63_02920 [Candidatus Riflebacteria bacterium RBG_13_59_9]|nr:MAG: hypothetical protein A2Y63_02920 [Candidatus Riflebacteria bacterium RBG_13_59_9]